MKNMFYGYYGPTEEEYQKLWSEALVVLDANVLLDMYRFPALARDELISVLESINDRLWVPHQVGLEFQRNRLTVISAERKITESALKSVRELVEKIVDQVESLQLDKRGIDISAGPLVGGLNKANDELAKAIQKAHDSQLDISIEDPIRTRLDTLLDGRVGLSPESQHELDGLIQDGVERYQYKIPPGFKDADKEKNPNEASFVFDKLKYQRKFGDLILWRQLINHLKNSQVKSVIFVTADQKEDWWWREQGKTIGPHPELVREIRREGGVELFWMYTSVQFVRHANQYISAKVSTQSVEEIEQVTQLPKENIVLFDDDAYNSRWEHLRLWGEGKGLGQAKIASGANKDASYYFLEWLSEQGVSASESVGEFPRILSYSGEAIHGYEIKRVNKFPDGSWIITCQHLIMRGRSKIIDGEISHFTIVFIISEIDYIRMLDSDVMEKALRKIKRISENHPEIDIIVGAIVNDRFDVLIHQNKSVGEV